jgi:hypothetical protein
MYSFIVKFFRLQRIKLQEDEKRLRDAVETERKLNELAKARGRYLRKNKFSKFHLFTLKFRSVPMSQMPSLNKGSTKDNDSESRNSSTGMSAQKQRPNSVGSAAGSQRRISKVQRITQVYILRF